MTDDWDLFYFRSERRLQHRPTSFSHHESAIPDDEASDGLNNPNPNPGIGFCLSCRSTTMYRYVFYHESAIPADNESSDGLPW